MPTFQKDIRTGIVVPLLKTDDISDGTITFEKLSPSLRSLIGSGGGSYMEAISNDEIDLLWEAPDEYI